MPLKTCVLKMFKMQSTEVGVVTQSIMPLLATPAPLIQVLVQDPTTPLLIQHPANVPMGTQKMTQVFEFLPPMWETSKEFLTPEFGLAQI